MVMNLNIYSVRPWDVERYLEYAFSMPILILWLMARFYSRMRMYTSQARAALVYMPGEEERE
jgi:hypothetical protein